MGLQTFDKHPSQLVYSFHSIRQYKSFAGGFFTLLYLFIGAVIIVIKIIQLNQHNQPNFTTFIDKSNDLVPLDISSSNVRLQFLKYNESGIINNQKLPFQDRYKYGINVTMAQYYVQMNNSKQTPHLSTKPMQQCNTYEFCMPNLGKQFPEGVYGRFDFLVSNNTNGKIFSKLMIVVEKCDASVQPTCQQYGKNTQKLIPFLVMNNNLILPKQSDHYNTISQANQTRTFQSMPLRNNQSFFYTVQMKKAIIQTDQSVLPKFASSEGNKLSTTTWFYDEEMNELMVNQGFSTVLINYDLVRSAYTYVYQRRFKKFDQILSQAVGLIALAGTILFGLYKGYNQWAFDQLAMKQLEMHNINPTLLNYYKYKFISIVGLLCGCIFKKLKQKAERNKQMESQLLRRLDTKRIFQYLNRESKTIRRDSQQQSEFIFSDQQSSKVDVDVSINKNIKKSLLTQKEKQEVDE